MGHFLPLAHWVAALAVLCLAGVARSETPVGNSNTFFRTLDTARGLPDNSVTGVVQAVDGYLWVATEGGLMRYNGTSLTEISLQRFPGVRNRSVKSIFFDRHGQLWAGMDRGPLIRLGRHGGRTFSAVDGAFDESALAISEDGAGAVWIAYPGGICRILDENVTRFTRAEGLPEGEDVRVTCDGAGQIWYAIDGHVGTIEDGKIIPRFAFAPLQVRIAAVDGNELWMAVGNRILRSGAGSEPEEIGRLPDGTEASVLFEDPAGALWIGSATRGLFRMVDGVVERVATSHPDVSCLSMDQEGNIWAGTDGGGLNLIRPRAMELVDRSKGLPFDSAVSVCEDGSGFIWTVGRGGGVARSRAGPWEMMPDAGGQAGCVSADVSGGIWVGTRDRGLLNFHHGVWRGWTRADGLASDSVGMVLNSSTGDVWIATKSPDSLQRLSDGKWTTMETDKESGRIVAMCEGSAGAIWIATENGRILRTGGGKLTEVPVISESSPLMIRSLLETPDGSLWIAYAGDGLGWYKDGKYARITSEEGLMDDYVSQLLADGEGALWIAANRGIFQVELADLIAVAEGRSKWVRSRGYGPGEGLPSVQPSRGHHPQAWRAGNGHLWFSMRNGLVVAQPEKIRDNPNPPEVLLEKVSLDEEAVALYGNRQTLQRSGKGQVLDLSNPDAVLHLPPGYGKLKFDFAALSFSSPENVDFRYRLVGFDKDWVDADTEHSAAYPRLPAGRYRFHVIACNNAGVWNKAGKSLALVVAPFFWETWWFKIGGGLTTVLLGGGAVYLSQRRKYKQQLQRIAAKRAIEQERSRIARDIHDDLGSNLTRIMLLSRPARNLPAPFEAGIMPQIHSTSRHLIRAMSEVVWAINPEQDSFDGLADYLSNHAQSFLALAGIRCRLDMPLKLPERRLSAQVRHNVLLAFKEALNNVVKHAQATEVRISLTPSDTGLILCIDDDGHGIGSISTAGNGLLNMRRRLAEIGGCCVVEPSSSGGTIVRFEIQLKKDP